MSITFHVYARTETGGSYRFTVYAASPADAARQANFHGHDVVKVRRAPQR